MSLRSNGARQITFPASIGLKCCTNARFLWATSLQGKEFPFTWKADNRLGYPRQQHRNMSSNPQWKKGVKQRERILQEWKADALRRHKKNLERKTKYYEADGSFKPFWNWVEERHLPSFNYQESVERNVLPPILMEHPYELFKDKLHPPKLIPNLEMKPAVLRKQTEELKEYEDLKYLYNYGRPRPVAEDDAYEQPQITASDNDVVLEEIEDDLPSLETAVVPDAFAVVSIYKQQHKVMIGDIIMTQKMPLPVGFEMDIENCYLLGTQDRTIIGRPLVPGVKVRVRVMEHTPVKPVLNFHFKRRKGYKKARPIFPMATMLNVIELDPSQAFAMVDKK